MDGMMQNILTALAVVVNGIPQGLLALTYGFAAFPTAVAFLVGIAGPWLQLGGDDFVHRPETITLAGTLGSNVRERLSPRLLGRPLLLIPSILGVERSDRQIHRPVIMYSMMAGRRHHARLRRHGPHETEYLSGTVSLVVALIVWFVKKGPRLDDHPSPSPLQRASIFSSVTFLLPRKAEAERGHSASRRIPRKVPCRKHRMEILDEPQYRPRRLSP